MDLTSLLQKIFSPPKTSDLDDEENKGWGQNIRIVMAIIIVFVSALIVWWMVS